MLENIYTKSRSFFWYLKVFGFFSVSFDGPVCNGKIKFKLRDKLVLLFKILLAIFLIVASLLYRPESDCCFSEMASTAWTLINHLEVVVVLLLIVHQWRSYEAIIEFYHHLNTIDSRVKWIERNFDEFLANVFLIVAVTTKEYDHQRVNILCFTLDRADHSNYFS